MATPLPDNQVLDDEIKSRLDKLNALSDLINSLELQFDEANTLFRNTLKCSTERLSSIARALGTKSIKHGRVYNAAKISVEQSQSDCQRACVLFEQANKDHQFAKLAIKEAESKLKKVAGEKSNSSVNTDSIDFSRLNLNDTHVNSDTSIDKQDTQVSVIEPICQPDNLPGPVDSQSEKPNSCHPLADIVPPPNGMINSVALLSEELNQAIMKLVEAERKLGQSERQHLDQANKLIVAQENLIKLEREYGPSIRRSQLYFDEAKRFNAKLNSVKGDICRISEDILGAKQAYARTLGELEQFSDDLHLNSLTG